MMKAFRKKVVSRLGPWLTYWAIKGLGLTMRMETANDEILVPFLKDEKPVIAAFWHGRLLMMPWIYKSRRDRTLSFLVSSHRDGRMVGVALERFGFRAIFGSTRRNGFSALKRMIEADRGGSDIAIAPDGPRGPRGRVQMGVIELAKLTGRPIVPLSFGASKKKIFKTWDGFLLPYPFSRGVFVFGTPVSVDRDGDRAHMEERRAVLEERLNELTEKADRYFE